MPALRGIKLLNAAGERAGLCRRRSAGRRSRPPARPRPVAEVMKASRACMRLGDGEFAFHHRDLRLGRGLQDHPAGDARQDGVGRSRVTTLPSRVHDPGIGRGAFGDKAVLVHQPGFEGARALRRRLGQKVGQQLRRLDVAAAPALVGLGDRPRCPCRGAASMRCRIERARRHDQRRPRRLVRHRHDRAGPRRA